MGLDDEIRRRQRALIVDPQDKEAQVRYHKATLRGARQAFKRIKVKSLFVANRIVATTPGAKISVYTPAGSYTVLFPASYTKKRVRMIFHRATQYAMVSRALTKAEKSLERNMKDAKT